ncbi:MAG: hypothetical protein P8R42_03900 [Candidatus Binatia bacterium]|nr:hypothetical protein [Candidatus Binatia bacterium]
MSGVEPVFALPVIVAGPPSVELSADLQGWTTSPVVLQAPLDPAILPDPARDGFVWLSPRTRIDADLRDALGRFGVVGRPRVGVAPHVAERAGGTVPLGDRVVVAEAGAARFALRGPKAVAGAEIVRLDCTIRVSAPERVGDHLRSINEESTIAAALGAHVGEVAGWGALALAPMVGTLRGWMGARGAGERTITVAFLESFAAAAAAAKLWELRNAEVGRPS